jgi:hypothetical protein
MPNPLSGDRPLTQRRVDSNRRVSTIAEQIANINQLQITSATSIDDLPRILVAGRTYLLESHNDGDRRALYPFNER